MRNKKLLNSVRLVRGGILKDHFSLDFVRQRQAAWDTLNSTSKMRHKDNGGYDKSGWVVVEIAKFMADNDYSAYTNVKSVEPGSEDLVRDTVRCRLTGLVQSLRTDVQKGREWGWTNYVVKNAHRGQGTRPEKPNDDPVETVSMAKPEKAEKAGNEEKAPEQADFLEQLERPAKKTFKKLPGIKGEPERKCKSKADVIDDIRHWQKENIKILHKENDEIKADIAEIKKFLQDFSTIQAQSFDRIEPKLELVWRIARICWGFMATVPSILALMEKEDEASRKG